MISESEHLPTTSRNYDVLMIEFTSDFDAAYIRCLGAQAEHCNCVQCIDNCTLSCLDSLSIIVKKFALF